MNSRAIASFAFSGLLVAALAGAAVAVSPRTEKPTKSSFVGDGNVGVTSYLFGSGFESGEGFALGPIEPQAGWTASGTNLPFASVKNLLPYTGLQHLRLIHDTTTGVGVNRIAFSPLQATAANTPSTVYVKIRISNDGGADHDVVAQAPSQGFLSWRVKFSWSGDLGTEPGTIYVLDDPGTGLAYINTGVLWTVGVYKELRVDFDPINGTIRYYYGGAPIYTGVVYAGTAVEQVLALTDNYENTGETEELDGLSVQTLGDPAVGVEATTWSRVKAMMR
jgi:hypothetical protein